jgi:hypothetical protein
LLQLRLNNNNNNNNITQPRQKTNEKKQNKTHEYEKVKTQIVFYQNETNKDLLTPHL